MKMSEIKSVATEIFNRYIDNTPTREYFANTFDLWSDSDALYSGHNQMTPIIYGFTVIIGIEIKRLEMLAPREHVAPTRKTRTTQSGTGNESVTENTEKNTSNENSRQSITGASGTSAYQYPDGYTGAIDQAYIRTRAEDDQREDTETSAGMGSETGERTNAKTNENTSESETTTTDDFLFSKLYDYSSKLSKLVNKCVFALVADTITGRF